MWRGIHTRTHTHAHTHPPTHSCCVRPTDVSCHRSPKEMCSQNLGMGPPLSSSLASTAVAASALTPHHMVSTWAGPLISRVGPLPRFIVAVPPITRVARPVAAVVPRQNLGMGSPFASSLASAAVAASAPTPLYVVSTWAGPLISRVGPLPRFNAAVPLIARVARPVVVARPSSRVCVVPWSAISSWAPRSYRWPQSQGVVSWSWW